MEADTELRDELESELDHLRNMYRKTKGLHKGEALTAIRSDIQRRAEEVKTQLAGLTYYPTLSEMRRRHEQDAADQVTLLIAWIVEKLNVKGNMTADQVETLAADIIYTYGWLRLEDVALCFWQALRGAYGPIYDRVDAAVVYGWLERYGEEVRTLRWEKQYARQVSFKEGREKRSSGSLRAFFYNHKNNLK